jgi:hypothetical protein
MGVDRDEFSGDDPNSFDTARAAADAPIGDPLNPEARAGDERPADAATDGKSNGNGAAHVDGKFTAGAEDSASEPSAPATQLCPNRADINKHLCALFHPDFVKRYPYARIEIATANPKAGKGKTGPMGAQHFSAFDLQAAGDCAERQETLETSVNCTLVRRESGKKPAT